MASSSISYSNMLRRNNPVSSRIWPSYNRNSGPSSNSKPNPPVTESLYLPKTCGFSLPFDPEISQDTYLAAIGDIVGDEKMVFGGKNNNIYKVYLQSEAEVNKLYENHPQIVIDNKILTVSKLVDNGYKIFLNNVEPGIPDHMLTKELAKYTKIVSQIKFVSLGSRNERFSHMIGFRRTVHVERIDNLPASFNLFFDNSIYKIFIVIDKVKCYKCNAEGHFSNNCPKDPVSVQERVANINKSTTPVTPSSESSGNQRTDGNISTFLPVFATKTNTASVTPISATTVDIEKTSSTENAPLESFTSPHKIDDNTNLMTQAFDVSHVSQQSELNNDQTPLTQDSESDTQEKETVVVSPSVQEELNNSTFSMEIDGSNQDKGTKRCHTDSPIKTKDKKGMCRCRVH